MIRQATLAGVAAFLLLAAQVYAQEMPAGVQTRTATSGKSVLADSRAMTLYVFDQDAAGKSNCNGTCVRSWPPLTAAAGAAPTAGWTIITRDDGSKQWAYQGRPLYTWINDRQPGDTTGDGVGGVWHVATLTGMPQAAAGSSASAQGSYGYGEPANAPGAHPSYPGLGPSGEHLETQMGPFKLRLYGTVLLNIQGSDEPTLGEDLPLWAVGGGGTVTFPDGTVGTTRDQHDLIFTMRRSIVGATINPATRSESGWNPSALVEVDFFGTRPVDTSQPLNRVLDQPRLRMAYLQLEHKNLKIVAGQDKAIISPLDPISLSHVAAPLGATAGDLWGWFPQVRLDISHDIRNMGVLFQVGVLAPIFGDTKLEAEPGASTSLEGTSVGQGPRSTQPFYEARLAVSPKIGGRTATLGIAGHFGQEKVGVNNILQSYALAFDLEVPFSARAILRGEGFVGSNLIPFQGGIAQGAAVLAVGGGASIVQRISSGGGWAELTLLPTSSGRDAVYLGAGTDDPKKQSLLPGSTRDKNSFIWASYFHKINNSVTAALEWSNWQFRTVGFVNNVPGPAGATGRANVFNLALAYQF